MKQELICQECNAPMKGRRDKKFCNDSCKNSYHNRLNAESNVLIKTMQNRLRKNRQILQALVSQGKRTIQRSHLLREGFDFQLITTYQTRRSGRGCYYCFDYGYIPIDEERLEVIHQEKIS
ncbi:MAG: hypothetical protein LPK45_00775 [Bacteroidota bacterium]|nr:hypothetical protein [Bacteroidota bacterium]MDX5429558.1 hypothetical protein [Bacteroidota bacterium]MDX5468345.1 hypothetical protein [Bacteroidota bacterium]